MTQPLNQLKEWEQRRDQANRYYRQGKFQESLDLASKNLDLARAIPDHAREGYTLND
ncbi:MAG: tetratricopeptide repeat protein, partial [Nostoc sp.]